MNAICTGKNAAFLEKISGIPTRSGFLLKKFSLRSHADRTGKRMCFLPLCITFLTCLYLLCPACVCAAEKLHYLDYATALQKGKDTQRPLLLFFTTPWCYQCTEMKRKVFQDKDIIATLNDRFLVVEVDISHEKGLKEDYRIYYTPTTMFLDSLGKPIIDLKGYIPTHRFRQLLRFVSGGHYKKTAFSDFEKK